MIGLALTLDYEIYGDGKGSLAELVVKPSSEFLGICEEHGGRATLFVDVAELLKMKEESFFLDEVHQVEEQLRDAHQKGHDVQLHIHPWWFNAQFRKGNWKMDYEMSTLCHLDTNDALRYIQLCKKYLTELLKPCRRNYSCIAFRAGGWSMMPTKNIFDALIRAGIEIDSSVYKWGIIDTENIRYDYSNAYSNIHPWFFSREDVNEVEKCSADGCRCLEMPIYAEHQSGLRFLTKKRISLMPRVRSTIVDNSSSGKQVSLGTALFSKFNLLTRKRAMKFDFCKCTFDEMKKMIHNIVAYNPPNGYLPVVAIGHSKDFIFKDDFSNLLKLIRSDYADIMEIVRLTCAAKKYEQSIATSK